VFGLGVWKESGFRLGQLPAPSPRVSATRTYNAGIPYRSLVQALCSRKCYSCPLTARSKTDARKRRSAPLLAPFNANVRYHMTPQDIADQKGIEYYASSVNAWFNTSLEHDKSVLALAAGGIGLLATLLTTVGLSSVWVLALYVAAILCFLVALVAVLVVFRHNRTYIERVLNGTTAGRDPLLSKADSVVLWAFGVGVVLTAVIGIATAIHSYASKEKTMTKDSQVTVGNVKIDTANIRESFNGLAKLQPAPDFTKSFNGAAGLKPPAPVASPSAPCAPVPAAPTSVPKAESGSSGK
jgi:hypothetical protein